METVVKRRMREEWEGQSPGTGSRGCKNGPQGISNMCSRKTNLTLTGTERKGLGLIFTHFTPLSSNQSFWRLMGMQQLYSPLGHNGAPGPFGRVLSKQLLMLSMLQREVLGHALWVKLAAQRQDTWVLFLAPSLVFWVASG